MGKKIIKLLKGTLYIKQNITFATIKWISFGLICNDRYRVLFRIDLVENHLSIFMLDEKHKQCTSAIDNA